MPISPGLEVWLYQPQLATPVKVPYGQIIEELTMTTAAPGGCRDLTAKVHLANARLPYPELGLFARVAVMGETPTGVRCVWQGEISDPDLALTQEDGEYLQLAALGYQAALLDDTISTSYSAQTVQQMAIDQLTGTHGGLVRTNFLPLDADTSALFPNNPVTTYSPAYPGYNMQDVLTNLGVLAGDYTWGVWPHPLGTQPVTSHKDAGGFPTAQVQAHVRDSTSVKWMALEEAGDVVEWHVVPSSERAYNVIVIAYNDLTQSPPVGLATATDARLAANGSQGSAPFRRRMLYRDLSGVSTVTKVQAQAIADAYLALYKNVTNKIAITLRAVRDGNGMPIPLWMPWADTNIVVPTLSIRGATIPTTRIAGTNLFYVVETSYTESSDDITLTLQCDNFVDTVESVVARLQTQSDALNRAGARTTGIVQAQGAPFKFQWSTDWGGWGTIGGHNGSSIDFTGTMANSPVSITMTGGNVSNAQAPTVQNITQYGAHIYSTPTANGAGFWIGTGVTNGNCILEVDDHDDPRGRFTHHCDGCKVVRKGLKLKRDLRIEDGGHHTRHGLTFICPTCQPDPVTGGGQVSESYSCTLGPEDEDPNTPNNWAWRAEQARLIRKVMAHPHVNLSRREHAPRA